MDLVYIPEIVAYGSYRGSQYRDYEQPWNKDYFNYGKSTHNQQNQNQQHKPQSKENCHLCKENKRRSLATYIRSKSKRSSCHGICEEEENETEQTQKTEKKN